jgi:hypothetical protein
MENQAEEIAELEARISELRHMLNFRVPGPTIEAIHDHIMRLQNRILQLQSTGFPRTNT